MTEQSDLRSLLPERRRGQDWSPVAIADIAEFDGGGVALVELADGRQMHVPVVHEGSWRRAVPGEGVSTAVFHARRSPESHRALDVDLISPLPPADPTRERELDVDMTNDLVIVDDSYAVKWTLIAADGSMAGPRLVRHLAATGFTRMPAPIATASWRNRLVASATAYISGAQDGWDWMVDDAAAMLRGTGRRPDWPAALGELVGALHRHAASPSDVIPTPVGRAGDLSPLVEHFRRILGESTSIPGRLGEGLARWRPGFEEAIAVLERAHDVTVIPVHGDLHAGQVLRDADGHYWISDFDGNPLLPAVDRGLPGPAAFDVASLLRTLDHVAIVAARRAQADPAAARDWSRNAREQALSAYRSAADPALLDVELLTAFEWLSPLHEAVYAQSYLPRWSYVPEAVLDGAPWPTA